MRKHRRLGLPLTADVADFHAEQPWLRYRSQGNLDMPHTQLCFWEWDSRIDPHSLALDAAWNAMLGLPGQNEARVTLKKLLHKMHPQDFPTIRSQWTLAYQQLSDQIEIPFRIRGAHNHWYSILARGHVAERDAQGHPVRISGVHLKLTSVAANPQQPDSHGSPSISLTGDYRLRDPLTGLPNRAAIQEHIALATDAAAVAKNRFAVIFLDIDHFKNLNDSLGHDIGDSVLRHAAQRLSTVIGNAGLVGRLGGDEFALIGAIDSLSDAQSLAARVRDALSKPFPMQGKEVRLSASLGLSLYPEHGTDGLTLMRHADLAMYSAKTTRGGQFRFFADELNQKIQHRFALENDLRRAMDRGELRVHYQPRVEFASGRTIGLEALVRWLHPRGPLVGPGEFIPIAEEIGLIGRLGDWVLRQACAQAVEWMHQGYEVPPISVNVSVTQFHAPDFAQSISSILKETGLSPRLLELEITENLMFEITPQTHAALDRIERMGVSLAVDDFGVGYSSLASLKRVPIQVLKIDQSFVHDIVDNPSDATLVSAILAMAKNLRLRVVAEGIETKDQLRILQDLGCRFGQGYFFSEPLPSNACAEAFLQEMKAA